MNESKRNHSCYFSPALVTAPPVFVTKPVRCDCEPCQGTGMGGFYPGSRCHYCNGKGWVLTESKEDSDE